MSAWKFKRNMENKNLRNTFSIFQPHIAYASTPAWDSSQPGGHYPRSMAKWGSPWPRGWGAESGWRFISCLDGGNDPGWGFVSTRCPRTSNRGRAFKYSPEDGQRIYRTQRRYHRVSCCCCCKCCFSCCGYSCCCCAIVLLQLLWLQLLLLLQLF